MNSALTAALVRWYRENKRDLPWRVDQDPYRVWLSEIILQQTRVVQGTAYFEKFIELFPDVHALAEAPEHDIMKAWQGLGYYSRARNLMATARQISGMGGKFPETAAELEKLKGIGPYTAAAIASISFGEAVPVLDGNVMRVLARYFGISEPIEQPSTRRAMTGLLQELIPAKNPGDFNQAMMEFGALICTPRSPQCGSCPVRHSCFALKENKVDILPVKQSKKAAKDLYLYYFIHRNKLGIAMRKRPETGIWHNLYEFPGIESPTELTTEQAMIQAGFTNAATIAKVSDEFRHILTHRNIHCRVIDVKSKVLPKEISEGILRQKNDKLRLLPVSRLMEKILDHLKLG